MRLWLIGGIDPTGGAGLLRDEWAARKLDPQVELNCLATAMTRQGDGRPARAFPIAVARVLELLDRMPAADAVKVGLVPARLADGLAARLGRQRAPVVVDPVICSTDGGDLGTSVDGLVALMRIATLSTPNLDEGLALTGEQAPSEGLAARVLEATQSRAVLLKNAPGAAAGSIRDALVDAAGFRFFERVRDDGPDPRGTGCSLATAIACGLGGGRSLDESVAAALTWLADARSSTRVERDGRHHLV